MKKFKALMLGLLSVLTLGLFVVTGAKVEAATDGDYVWLPANSGTYSAAVPTDYQIFDFSTYTGTNKFTLQNAGTLSSSLMPATNTYTTATWDKEALVTGGNRTITISLASNQTAAVTVYSYTTGDRTITIGDTAYGIKNEFKNISGTLDATHNTIVFSNNKLVVLEIDVTITTSTKTNEELAAEAISAIGTVAYTSACKELIDAAAVKVAACSDTSAISNYSTYETAVSTFNSLKATAISNFTTAVNDIGTVTASSGTAISTAQTYYDVLFGDALTNADVVAAKATLDEKYDSYNDIMYDTYSKTATFSGLTSGDYTDNFVISNTIYSGLCSSGKKFTVDNSRHSGDYTGAIKTNGASTFTFGSEARVIKFKTKAAGTLTVVAQAGGDSNTRKAAVYTIGASSNTKLGDATTTTTTTSYSFDITSAGEYLLGAEGDGIWFYYISFEETPAVTVTAYQQEAVDGAYTYVRFIFVVSNDTTLATADFANKLTLILDDGETTEQKVTRSPKAYNKITLGGSTYTNGTYEFDNTVNTNDIYVVYVVKFTTATYVGHNIKASLNVNSNDYKTSGYDFE